VRDFGVLGVGGWGLGVGGWGLGVGGWGLGVGGWGLGFGVWGLRFLFKVLRCRPLQCLTYGKLRPTGTDRKQACW
jgi:hypothetical protein